MATDNLDRYMISDLEGRCSGIDHRIGEIERKLGGGNFMNQIGPNLLRRNMADLEQERTVIRERIQSIKADIREKAGVA